MIHIRAYEDTATGWLMLGHWECETRPAAIVQAANFAWAASCVGRVERAVVWWDEVEHCSFESKLWDDGIDAVFFTDDAYAIASEHLGRMAEDFTS